MESGFLASNNASYTGWHFISFLTQGRRRHILDASLIKKEGEDDIIQDKLKDSNKENKDIEEISSNAEKIENEMALGNRKTTPKQKEKRAKQEEESDRESDEEEERRQGNFFRLLGCWTLHGNNNQ